MNKEIEVLIDCECVDTERSRSINANKLKSKKYNKVYDSVDKKINSTDNIYLGRTYADAPEVDGMVYVHAKRKLTPGDFVKVRIKDTFEYDLVGEQL
jgi:ribosomal protein S12 methylthiotransferase